MNDIIRLSFLEVAQHQQKELLREAERSRLLSEAPRRPSPRIVRFVRSSFGGLVIAIGERIEGCTAAAQADESVDASAALKLAR